jgi:osomolarity two-component system, response regulator SSK1
MSGPRLPTTRLSPSIREESDTEDRALPVDSWDGIQSKPALAFAWSPESLMSSSTPSPERTISGSASSSEDDDSDDSEIEDQPLSVRQDAGQATDSDSIDSSAHPAARLPRITRAFSMPLSQQLGHLRHPHRMPTSSQVPTVAAAAGGQQQQQQKHRQHQQSTTSSPHNAPLHDLSVELADCVQIMIQTLLQVSPPQILDPAKEQFSACSLSVPTPSMAAMFTAMKNLNYISAHVGYFTEDGKGGPVPWPSDLDNFDIRELLQSVGDALSGVTAQAGVDLILFHGDVDDSIKDIPVRGNETGTSYVLSHV